MNTYILQKTNIATVFDNFDRDLVSSCCSAIYNEDLEMCEDCSEHCSGVEEE